MSGARKKRKPKEQQTFASAAGQQSSETAGEDEEKLSKHRDGAKNRHGQSQVCTATKDTLFSQKTAQPPMHPFSLQRVFGMNLTLPVVSLQDQSQHIFLYGVGHFGIIFNHTTDSQHILQGHSSSISCMCVTENRRWIATADSGSPSMVIIWDSYSGIPVKTLFDCHPASGVAAVAFSGDAKYLATLGRNGCQSICIWDWTSDAQKPLYCTELNPKLGFQDYITFNPNDSTQVFSVGESHMFICNRTSGNKESLALKTKSFMSPADSKVFAQPSPYPSMWVYSADRFPSRTTFDWRNHRLLKAIANCIVVWTINEVSHVRKISTKEPITVLTTHDGYVVTGDMRGEIRFYDKDFTVVSCCEDFHLDPIVSISFSKDIPMPAYREECTLEEKPLVIRNFLVSTVSFKVIHVNTSGGTQTLLQNDDAPLHAVACHPSHPTVALGNQRGVLKLWDHNQKLISGIRVFEEEKHINCVAFDPKGRFLAVGFGTGAVYILDACTLQNNPDECFHCATDSIDLITFSSDSQYLATADVGKAVTVFCSQTNKDASPQWMYLGRYCYHNKPIKDLLFGVHLDSAQPRLLSLGSDRQLVEYDLKNSHKDKLLLLRSERIEQSAVPQCIVWHPPLNAEELLLVASDQYKMKLFNSKTLTCRKTLLGPTYGSPIKQILVLPKSKDAQMSSYHLAFITEDKLGLQILPLDGNPYKSTALICHPTGVSSFACSYDGKFLFTAGRSDSLVMSWRVNLDVLHAATALGGKDMEPFYSMLDGGRDGRFYREMEDFFYYCIIRHQGAAVLKRPNVCAKIPLSDIPDLVRALGHFPTEKELEDMQNEIKFSQFAETGKHVTDIGLEEFIKLYINHRPAFGISSEELVQAFHVLGKKEGTEVPVLLKNDLLELLQAEGEHMTEKEVAECFATLLQVNKNEGEEETHCEGNIIPEEISAETFTDHILGLPFRNAQSTSPSE
ncbi:cilia- and flagella-associated protein 251 [Cyprinodon tularosa]|uniref:cilia- and flagella-associated protein 251 n=1 Tax=Cyprinodon tularosa TaxID=77115 RepID=UPI0018E224E9|nr:cilia- and flagella-associated protein 251 [Cyprinodon tularosa]